METIMAHLKAIKEEGYREGVNNEKNKSKWVLLPIGKNELLVCDSCYKDIKRQDMHINITDESVKVLCEECWKSEVEANE